ncbi:hypothetical protein MKK58_02795 [Methylobacterium sp. J-078]|uniref:hypothetical protein n=1 Tax=Methylobacterium sp. J-078 TaxID=2836657 RepID=UPI001FB8A8A4|nr:hypothetical protein [Methylobacterium sp. J-078]MCJ2043477.1 hypothetical protein [Methylobacterium sp. J-078]
MSERESVINFPAGFYLLRYKRSVGTGEHPTIEVRVPPEHARSIILVSSPFEDPGIIGRPGGCLVIRAEHVGEVRVIVRPRAGSRNGEAELELEPLAHDSTTGSIQHGRGSKAGGDPEISVLGHVSRRGDITVGSDIWLAGPDAPAPIEGIALQLQRGDNDLSLEYQVLIGDSKGGWTPWAGQTNFVGTRGMHKPIVGFRVRLTGQSSRDYTLNVSGLFLGANIETKQGSAVELLSPAEIDPLVGLKVSLAANPQMGASATNQPRSQEKRLQQPRADRVRVFRSSLSR